jgi:hypothetical protein
MVHPRSVSIDGLTMNSSEVDSEWSGVPDMYEIELSAESHRLSLESGFNDTNNNATLTVQGIFFFLFRFLLLEL